MEEGNDDDGDRDCGKDLASLPSVKDATNVVLVVSVWISQKGDGNRSKHIVKTGSDQLEACGFGKKVGTAQDTGKKGGTAQDTGMKTGTAQDTREDVSKRTSNASKPKKKKKG
eukprot:g26219.t1